MLDQGHVLWGRLTFRSGLMLYTEDAMHSCGLAIYRPRLGWGYSIRGSGNGEKSALEAAQAGAGGSGHRERGEGEGEGV